jgi:hypothetical protein
MVHAREQQFLRLRGNGWQLETFNLFVRVTVPPVRYKYQDPNDKSSVVHVAHFHVRIIFHDGDI